LAIASFYTRPKWHEAGFTLVEILCVLALLGLTAGLVVLNLPKAPPPIRAEVQALVTMLNLTARESVIDGHVRGLDVQSGGVEMFRYDGEWVSEARRDFTDVFGVELKVEGQNIDLKARTKSKEDLPPLIEFDATGNVTTFILAVSGREESFVLSPDPRGRIVIGVQP